MGMIFTPWWWWWWDTCWSLVFRSKLVEGEGQDRSVIETSPSVQAVIRGCTVLYCDWIWRWGLILTSIEFIFDDITFTIVSNPLRFMNNFNRFLRFRSFNSHRLSKRSSGWHQIGSVELDEFVLHTNSFPTHLNPCLDLHPSLPSQPTREHSSITFIETNQTFQLWLLIHRFSILWPSKTTFLVLFTSSTRHQRPLTFTLKSSHSQPVHLDPRSDSTPTQT